LFVPPKINESVKVSRRTWSLVYIIQGKVIELNSVLENGHSNTKPHQNSKGGIGKK